MTNNTKLDENLEGVENFRAWKYIVMLILEEYDLEGYVKDEVPKLEEDEAKTKHKKDMVKSKRIIDDYQGSLDSSSILKEYSKRHV